MLFFLRTSDDHHRHAWFGKPVLQEDINTHKRHNKPTRGLAATHPPFRFGKQTGSALFSLEEAIGNRFRILSLHTQHIRIPGGIMSPTMAMTMAPAMYTPTSDAMERHEYGITKHHRKNSSTGGGRAWSEDEVRGPFFPSFFLSFFLVDKKFGKCLITNSLPWSSSNRKSTCSRLVYRRCHTSTSPPT